MLTELITGGELHAALRQIPTVLSPPQAQFYTGSLVIVLEELSDRNILYRDLKPENVMLDSQGYLKLIDFGIAKLLPEGISRTYTMIGTPHYLAPEVIQGQGYGVAVDLWSLGVMLYEFVIGVLPFGDDFEDPTDVCAAVLKEPLTYQPYYTDELGKKLIGGLLEKKAKNRLGSGIDGFVSLKESEYFRKGHPDTSLFSKIMSRELTPPWVPPAETYSPGEGEVENLSDEEEMQDATPLELA